MKGTAVTVMAAMSLFAMAGMLSIAPTQAPASTSTGQTGGSATASLATRGWQVQSPVCSDVTWQIKVREEKRRHPDPGGMGSTTYYVTHQGNQNLYVHYAYNINTTGALVKQFEFPFRPGQTLSDPYIRGPYHPSSLRIVAIATDHAGSPDGMTQTACQRAAQELFRSAIADMCRELGADSRCG